MADWLVSIGTGRNQQPLINAAAALGYKVLGLDRTPNHGLVHDALAVSTHEPDAALAAVLDWQKENASLTAVLARTSGPGIETAAHIADALKLPSYSAALADACVHKSTLASTAAELGLAHVPCLNTATDLPLVVKPDSPLCGKAGVHIVRDLAQLEDAKADAVAASVNGRHILQPYIDGPEFGLATAVRQGDILWHCFYQEHVNETPAGLAGVGVSGPADHLPDAVRAKARSCAQALCAHWQNTGFCFFSFRVDNKQAPLVFEVNPGLCGDKIADELFPGMWPGTDFFALDVALMTGGEARFPSLPGRVCRIAA